MRYIRSLSVRSRLALLGLISSLLFLIIAIGTVKKHLNNIYGKLSVGNRTGALARARELGLL